MSFCINAASLHSHDFQRRICYFRISSHNRFAPMMSHRSGDQTHLYSTSPRVLRDANKMETKEPRLDLLSRGWMYGYIQSAHDRFHAYHTHGRLGMFCSILTFSSISSILHFTFVLDLNLIHGSFPSHTHHPFRVILPLRTPTSPYTLYLFLFLKRDRQCIYKHNLHFDVG